MNLVSREKAIDVAIDEYNRGYKEGFEAGKASVSGDGDLISRQAAIDALGTLCDRECEYSKKQRSVMCGACHLGSAFDVINELPSAQPYTEAEIQKMQDLEQAEIQKAFELGKAEALSEIVRCKDCKHRPYKSEDQQGFGVEFPDNRCPCQCEDGWYNWRPNDDWFCANAERRTDD